MSSFYPVQKINKRSSKDINFTTGHSRTREEGAFFICDAFVDYWRVSLRSWAEAADPVPKQVLEATIGASVPVTQ